MGAVLLPMPTATLKSRSEISKLPLSNFSRELLHLIRVQSPNKKKQYVADSSAAMAGNGVALKPVSLTHSRVWSILTSLCRPTR